MALKILKVMAVLLNELLLLQLHWKQVTMSFHRSKQWSLSPGQC
jgi:hypothetical protein